MNDVSEEKQGGRRKEVGRGKRKREDGRREGGRKWKEGGKKGGKEKEERKKGVREAGKNGKREKERFEIHYQKMLPDSSPLLPTHLSWMLTPGKFLHGALHTGHCREVAEAGSPALRHIPARQRVQKLWPQ